MNLSTTCAFKARKLFTLLALLSASTLAWADTKYCGHEITGGYHGHKMSVTYKALGSDQYTLIMTSVDPIVSYNAGSNFYTEVNGAGGTNVSANLVQDGNTLTFTVTSSPKPNVYVGDFYVNYSDGEEHYNIPTDEDWTAACPSKPSPELSLNASTKTLEIDATPQTFQIVPTKAAGSGVVSYSSNAEGVATVSNSGLVTAVGAGSATITVSVEENGDFAAESKTLTVTVIDWSTVGWLTNSGDSYKLHISPEIGDNFGGKRIEGSNIWVGCPSADFGACSIEFTHVGAGASFPLINFTKARNQFTLVCQGTTYTFTVYRKFDGVNLAKNMPTYAGATALPKAEANDGNKGSRWASGGGAKHYATYKDLAEDWWYVDLGAMYEISSIKTLFEGASPKNYDFLTSPNGDSWVVIDSHNATPNIGNGEANYNEYSYSPGKVGRYVKIFAREAVQADFAYGISMWEFEVYGLPAEDYDTSNPVLASAALNGTPTTSQVQIAVSATDAEGAVTTYRVKDGSNGVDRNCSVAAGVITISDLTEGTSYNFTVTALDAIGNQSNAIVVAASTAADQTIPQVAAPTPDGTGKEVLAIYSDVFPNILAHSFDKDGWAGTPVFLEKDFSGNKCLVYDMSSTKYTTWGMYNDGGDAIIAASGYSDPDDEGHKGVDASAMEKLHIDIWSLQACATILIRINDGARTGDLRLSHSGSGWQSYDIPLSEFEAGANTNNVRWFKFEAFDAITGKIAIDNVYFWKPESNSKSVSVSVNNGSMGSATAKVEGVDVTIVTDGTEVTFAATPNDGYDFVNWTNGGVEVSTSATYVATITASTALVANFEVHRTAYCGTPVTDNAGGTLYLTISNPSANTYKILFEGSENNKINSNNVYLDTQLRLRNVNDVAEYHFSNGEGIWHVSTEGFGSAYITFTAANFRNISFSNKHICLFRNNAAGGSDLSIYDNIPDANLIKWDATCTDDEAPVLAAPVATPLSGTSVRLTLSATDNMAALLAYNVNYKPANDAGAGTDIEVAGTAGATTYRNIKGLLAGVRYQFTVTASDGTNTSESQVCYATPSMATAPVPTHNADLVRSVYSDKYESALAHDFNKNTWVNPTFYAEQTIGSDHLLVYTSDDPTSMPQIAWGVDNDGEEAIIAKDGLNDGTNKGLDVRQMHYIHFDIWSAVATTYPEFTLNNTIVDNFSVTGSGWQSFDLPLASLTDEQKSNIRWIKFQGLRDPNPEEVAIDNVYFWRYGVKASAENWATFAASVPVKVPDGVTVYNAVYSNENGVEQLTLTDAGDVIPANEGVLLKNSSPSATYAFTLATSDEATAAAANFEGNKLVGCAIRTDISAEAVNNDIFCLRRSDAFDMSGFFLYSGQYIPAGKAYLKLPKETGAPAGAARRVRFVVNTTNTTTAIDNNVEAVSVTKFIENGQLYILRGNEVYTIQGTRVK